MTRDHTAYQIIQLTDCHLFADPTVELRGIRTWPRFLAAIEDAQRRFPDADLLTITGDTAHDEQPATYESVRKALGSWGDRLRIIPGNHDHRNALLDTFPAGCQAVGDRVTFEVRQEHWQIIGLDSHLPGEVAGSLLADQLRWLDERLSAHPELATLILVHHPAIDVGSPWLDRLRLQDAESFTDLLTSHRHVRLVGCGHVHQEVTSHLAGATLFTTPAVGPPFRPRTMELEIEPRPPSYRVIELSPGGNWRTQVIASPNPAESPAGS